MSVAALKCAVMCPERVAATTTAGDAADAIGPYPEARSDGHTSYSEWLVLHPSVSMISVPAGAGFDELRIRSEKSDLGVGVTPDFDERRCNRRCWRNRISRPRAGGSAHPTATPPTWAGSAETPWMAPPALLVPPPKPLVGSVDLLGGSDSLGGSPPAEHSPVFRSRAC